MDGGRTRMLEADDVVEDGFPLAHQQIVLHQAVPQGVQI